jgi:hypothetical protein
MLRVRMRACDTSCSTARDSCVTCNAPVQCVTVATRWNAAVTCNARRWMQCFKRLQSTLDRDMVRSETAKLQFSRSPNREHRRMRHRIDLPIPTPAKARKIWESMANPSTRRVATRLRQAGLSVSHMQVARWRNQGWRPVAQKDHPLEAARKSLDDAMPLLTGNPNATANVFLEKKTARGP